MCILSSSFCAQFVLYYYTTCTRFVSEVHKENIIRVHYHVVSTRRRCVYKTHKRKNGYTRTGNTRSRGPLMSVINFDFKLYLFSFFFRRRRRCSFLYTALSRHNARTIQCKSPYAYTETIRLELSVRPQQ